MKPWLCAAAFALCGISAEATPTNWSLTASDGSPLGTLAIDFATSGISGAVAGQFGTYSKPGYATLNTPGHVSASQVFDFFKLFDPTSGTTYSTDYGNGESEIITLNEVAVEVGTLFSPLSPLGGTFEVIIREVLNLDQALTTCILHEDVYDPVTGEYLGQGACAYYDTVNNYNIGSENVFSGYLTFIPPVAAVPLPASGLLLVAGLGALTLIRRKRA